jgi:hypothetical protein
MTIAIVTKSDEEFELKNVDLSDVDVEVVGIDLPVVITPGRTINGSIKVDISNPSSVAAIIKIQMVATSDKETIQLGESIISVTGNKSVDVPLYIDGKMVSGEYKLSITNERLISVTEKKTDINKTLTIMEKSDAKAIARWNIVPCQTVKTKLGVGVVAFHIHGISHVEFFVDDKSHVVIAEATYNPYSDTVEYWFELDANTMEDGLVNISAVVYPKNGIPRELIGPLDVTNGEYSIPLTINKSGIFKEIKAYVSPEGSDEKGNGTAAAPFKNIIRAARFIQDVSGSGNADGGVIKLMAGDYVYGGYKYSLLTRTENRWLTITTAEGVTKDEVRIIAGETGGIRTKLVHLKNITIEPLTPSVPLQSNGPLEDYIWIDNCNMVGLGAEVDMSWLGGWTHSFATDVNISKSRDGLGSQLQRNVFIENIGSDAFTAKGLTINCRVKNINKGKSKFHPDVVQYNGVVENAIVYNLTAVEDIVAQGVFAGKGVEIKDLALINVNIDNTSDPSGFLRAFQFLSVTNQLYIKDSTFTGPCSWREDMGFAAKDVVVDNCWFGTGNNRKQRLNDVSGVIYR